MNNSYAHELENIVELEFEEREKKFPQHVVGDNCKVRLLKILKGEELDLHSHP